MPEDRLSVAVFVGQAEDAGADLVQLYEREEGRVRGREAVLAAQRRSGRNRKPVHLPWDEPDPLHLQRAAAREGRVMLAGRLGPNNVRKRCAQYVHGPSTRRRSSKPSPDQGQRQGAGVRGGGALTATAGLFGPDGGRYVPETLIPALDELEGRARGQADVRSTPSSTTSVGPSPAGRPR